MPALMVMGLMYNAGVGTPVDLQQSYMWFTLMAAHVPADDANSRAVADRYLAMLSAKLTPAQIEDAQKAARAWAPIPPK
jgi:TPR repeat protein